MAVQDFNDFIQTKKGNIGEYIIDDLLLKRNYIIYKPINNNLPHLFDRLVLKEDGTFLIVEIKTKAYSGKHPDTGIDISHYNKYIKITKKYNIPLFLVFVDEILEKIYGNYLHILSKEGNYYYKNIYYKYPKEWEGIIYFYMGLMKDIYILNKNEVKKLKKYSTRNYKYLS